MAKRVSAEQVAQLRAVVKTLSSNPGAEMPGSELAAACRCATALLAARFPGGTVELRVPPFTAVQLGIGERGRHTRGTPPNVVQTDPRTLLRLAGGDLTWAAAVAEFSVQASGVHADLSEIWPLPELRH